MFDEYAEPESNLNDDDATLKRDLAPELPAYLTNLQNSKVTQVSVPPVNNNHHAAVSVPQPVYVPRASRTPPPPTPLMRDSAARARARRRHGRRANGGEWAWVIIAVAMFSVVIILGMSTFLLLRSSQAEQEVLPTAAIEMAGLPTPVNLRTAGGELVTGQTITLEDGYSLILEPWDGHSRLTVLLMGIDRRTGETGLAYRTDTMILLSIDPQEDRIGILSIPRDLYVEVPGWSQYQRINTPMVLGENSRPGTGPTLAMQTVQYNLGIRVHEYIVVDFNAVVGLVDAIGGITVTNQTTINDRLYPDMNYGYDPFYLPAGTHTLDGLTALKYSRTRHGDSDIDRARRQQEVIYAIRDRVLDFDMLPQLIIKAPTLMTAFRDNVHTSLSLEQIIRLAWYIKDMPPENIESGVIDFTYMSNWTTAQGAQVLIPNRARLGNLMVSVFGPNFSE